MLHVGQLLCPSRYLTIQVLQTDKFQKLNKFDNIIFKSFFKLIKPDLSLSK